MALRRDTTILAGASQGHYSTFYIDQGPSGQIDHFTSADDAMAARNHILRDEGLATE